MSTGVVRWFDAQRGFGWIKDDADPDGRELFVHFSQIELDGFKTLYTNDVVAFERATGDRGPRAITVRILD